MIASSRRTLLKGSLAAGAAIAFPAALKAARGNAPGLFVYDARFAASRLMAAEWEARGVPVLDPRSHDLGVAWRQHIPRLLAANGRIEGATLWSDHFVCETFAKDHGLRRSGEGRPLQAEAGALRHWVLA